MIARILHAGRSFRVAMEYNVGKVFGGVASIVAYNELPDGNVATAWRRFREMEENPAVSARTRAFGFHLALSPGPEDPVRLDEGMMIRLAGEVMDELGYSGQPWVMFRHNDIDREHYHIVSIRVRDDGKSLWKSFDANQLLPYLRGLESKYGFVVGKAKDLVLDLDGPGRDAIKPLAHCPRRFDPSKAEVKRQLYTIFEEALRWNYTDFAQFAAVLETMGVSASARARRSGNGYNIVVRGVGEDGQVISRPYSLEREFGIDAMARFNDKVEDRKVERTTAIPSRMKCWSVCEYAMQQSRSLDEFRQRCDECGVSVSVLTGRGRSHIHKILLADRKNRAVFDAAEFCPETSASAFRRLILSGQWHEADDKEKEEMRKARLTTKSDIGKVYARIQQRLEPYNGRPIDLNPGLRRSQGESIGLGLGRK